MNNQEYNIISVNNDNIESEHICCAIGNDKTNKARALIKKAWLKQRFAQGHIFKKIDVRGKVFIEYAPAEQAWFPVIAPGYAMIHCFWVSGKYKGRGLGTRLLAECENDCKDKNGIIAVTAKKKKSFMVDKKFYLKHGYQVCNEANPFFELVVKKFNSNAPDPCFTEKAKSGKIENNNELVFYYSDICPFNEDFVNIMINTAKNNGFKYKKIKIESLEQAKELPAASGVFSLFYNGEFLSHEIMTEGRFDKLLKNLKSKS